MTLPRVYKLYCMAIRCSSGVYRLSDWAQFNQEPRTEPNQTFVFFGFRFSVSVFWFQCFGVRSRCRFVDVENRTTDQNRSLQLCRRALPLSSSCKCQPHGTKAWPKAHHVDNQNSRTCSQNEKQNPVTLSIRLSLTFILIYFFFLLSRVASLKSRSHATDRN
jgi:hypothetical protein